MRAHQKKLTQYDKKENKMNKEVKLSKPAFVVLDQLIKEHKDLYGNISFKTFCDGEHKRITTNQVNKELDALYDHYYKNKGGKDGEGIE